MYQPREMMCSAAVAVVLSIACAAAVAQDAADEGSKLKALESAMKGAAQPAPAKGIRTRSIVFDAAETEKAPAATAAAVAAPARISDCKAIAADAKVTPVDFAIQFRSGRAEIAQSSEDTLRQIGKILALSPDRCILVEGHTDSAGDMDRNMALSRERSISVVKFIVEKAGLDASRLVPIGKGPTEPLMNLDPRDAKNRRVVFKVVG